MTTTQPMLHDRQAAQARRQDWWYAAGLLVLTAIIYWPVARWLTSETFAHEQLKQSLFVVLLAGAWIYWEKRDQLRPQLRLSNATLVWLFTSYLIAACALVFRTPLLVLAGLIVSVGGAVNYIFGPQALRRTLPLLAVFALLIFCVLIFPVLDWPLRRMAGVESARFLKFLGLAPQLAVTPGPNVQLLLLAGTQTFLVQTECNGFGLITSSVLLATILLLYRHAPTWKYALVLPFSIALAFVFNFLRISAIVLLAPYFPGHYHAMHETAGLVALYAGLGTILLVAGRR